MVRYIMSFSVPEGRQDAAQKVIDAYFRALSEHGPGGMRSQCYANNDNDCNFVHIKSFKEIIHRNKVELCIKVAEIVAVQTIEAKGFQLGNKCYYLRPFLGI